MTCGGGLDVSASGVKRKRARVGWECCCDDSCRCTHLLGRLDGNGVLLRDGDLHGFGGVVLGG